jgi:hypothetical protein
VRLQPVRNVLLLIRHVITVGGIDALTATETAAKPMASYRRERTCLEHRPSTRLLLDGPGQSAHNYGSEGRARTMRRCRVAEHLDYAVRACPCPRDVPEPPSTASDRHQQQPANMKLGRAFNPRATHGNTLVMRRPRKRSPTPARAGGDAAHKARPEWLMCLVGGRARWNADDHE